MSKHSFKIKSSRKVNSLFDEAVSKKPSISRSTATYNRWGVTSYSPVSVQSRNMATLGGGTNHSLINPRNDLSHSHTASEDIFSFGSDASDDEMSSPPSMAASTAKRYTKSSAIFGRESLKRNGEKLDPPSSPENPKSRRVTSTDYELFTCSPTSPSTHELDDLDDTLTQQPASPAHSTSSSSASTVSDARSQLNSDLDFDVPSRTPSPAAFCLDAPTSSEVEPSSRGKPPLRCTIRINNAAKLTSERLKVMDSTVSTVTSSLSAKVGDVPQPPIVRRILSAPIKVKKTTYNHRHWQGDKDSHIEEMTVHDTNSHAISSSASSTSRSRLRGDSTLKTKSSMSMSPTTVEAECAPKLRRVKTLPTRCSNSASNSVSNSASNSASDTASREAVCDESPFEMGFDEPPPVTKLTCKRANKHLFAVVHDVKMAHDQHERGESMQYDYDIDYISEGIVISQAMAVRSASTLSLVEKCINDSFRMHLRAHDKLSALFAHLDDAASNPVSSTIGRYGNPLCEATYVNSLLCEYLADCYGNPLCESAICVCEYVVQTVM